MPRCTVFQSKGSIKRTSQILLKCWFKSTGRSTMKEEPHMRKLVLGLSIWCATGTVALQAQRIEIPYSGTAVTVVIDSTIFAGWDAVNHHYDDDYPDGLFIEYITEEQDGSKGVTRVLEGTNYYKHTPDTITFTSNSDTHSLSVWSVAPSPGSVWQGQYNVKVNGVLHDVKPSHIVYRSDPRLPVLENANEIPDEYALLQNFPNPFNPSTTIRYGVPHKTTVQLAVFNALGQSVSTLVNGEQEAGYHEVKFDGSELSSGVYFYRIEAGSFVQTRKLLLLR
jgi:hypothetical protein